MGSAVDVQSVNMKLSDSKHDVVEDFGENLKVLPTNDQIKELQTILRDRYES
jgi:uracil phosphoribosyltransferase